jgi:hypothetical protein
MTRHIPKLHYEGLLVARHELATSTSKQVVQGAQMFLGAHAHYYLSGTVPGIWDATKLEFGMLLLASYRAWAEGRLFEDPPFERREPYLEGPTGNREPVFGSLP